MRGSKFFQFITPAVLLGLFLFLLDLEWLQARVGFYVFQTRDLLRALDLLQGNILLYGPEMTGGGNLPGPFYYFLLAAFLWIEPVWQAAWYGMVLLAGVGVIAGFYFWRAHALWLAALLWIPFFIDSPHVQHLFAVFINPSYLFCFVILILICAALSFSAETLRVRERSFLAASLITALAIQIHLSAIFLYLAMIFMQWRAERLRLPRLPKRTFLTGLLIFIVPIVPYVVWNFLQRFGMELGVPGAFTGNPESVWPTYAYLIKGRADLANVGAVMIKETLKVVPWTLLLLLVAVAGERRAGESPRFLKPLLVCAAFSFIPFSYIYLVPIANRYGLPLNLSLIFIALILFNHCLDTRRRLVLFNTVALIALVALWTWSVTVNPDDLETAGFLRLGVMFAVCLAAFWRLEKKRELKFLKAAALVLALGVAHFQGYVFETNQLPLIQGNMARLIQWRKIWTKIMCQSGWTYEQASERVFFVNSHIDEDPRTGFESTPSVPYDPHCGTRIPSGFFVAINLAKGLNFKEWLLAAPIADEIKEGLRRGDIELGPTETSRVTVVPYFVVNTENLPENFHDIALAYRVDHNAEIFDRIATTEGVERLQDERILFKWNECPGNERYCNHGAVVNVQQEGQRLDLSVRILGSPLAQVSPWIHPTWTQALDNPYIEVKCDGKIQRRQIARSVGFKRKYLYYEPITNYFVANNSFIAPFERKFKLACGKLEEISFGREASSVDYLRGSVNLPGKKQTFELK